MGAVAVAMVVGLPAAGPAQAAARTPVGVTSVVEQGVLDVATRDHLLRVARRDPRSTVRAVAWAALISDDVDAAIIRYHATEYPYAVGRSAETAVLNADFARRVLQTHTKEFAPEVHAAAQFAIRNGPVTLEAFARTGYAAAKERDRRARDAIGQQAAALVQADREFVRRLRDSDPGEQVRAAAAFALRVGATDSDLVEFFAHDWVSAAELDLAMYRIRCADEDARWRGIARALVVEARAAEEKARELAGEAAEQERAAAARAWARLGQQAGPARVAWAQAQQVAQAQAAAWQQVVQAAGGATSSNWQVIVSTGQPTAEQWAAERDNAAAQAEYWTALYEQALAGEQGGQPAEPRP